MCGIAESFAEVLLQQHCEIFTLWVENDALVKCLCCETSGTGTAVRVVQWSLSVFLPL